MHKRRVVRGSAAMGVNPEFDNAWLARRRNAINAAAEALKLQRETRMTEAERNQFEREAIEGAAS